jgi:hypothetical protein
MTFRNRYGAHAGCIEWGAFAWHLTSGYFVHALERARRHFETIEVDRLRVKPKVKITGEFYLQTVEGAPNYNIHHWLETEGAEFIPRRSPSGSIIRLASMCKVSRSVSASTDMPASSWRG